MVAIGAATPEPARLGECPIWSVTEQVLYWIDIDGRAVHRLDPSTGTDEICRIDSRPGSIALTEAPGALLLATEHRIGWLDFDNGRFEPWLTVESMPGVRLNDGRTDPAGRFVVGSMFEDTRARRFVGSLHQVEADGTHTVLRSGIGVSNGIAFDVERGRAYFADSPTGTVIQWDYDVSTASRTNERVFFEYGEVAGKPDGACVDSDGYYWSASVRGWAVTRVAPDGSVDRVIDVPVAMPSMPAFGGANLDQLYVTSIDIDEPGRDGFAQGALLVIDLAGQGITGVAETPFAGTPAN